MVRPETPISPNRTPKRQFIQGMPDLGPLTTREVGNTVKKDDEMGEDKGGQSGGKEREEVDNEEEGGADTADDLSGARSPGFGGVPHLP